MILSSVLLAAVYPLSRVQPTDVWAGRATHPAVVNPVAFEKFGRPADNLSLAGEWDLRTAAHGSGLRTVQVTNDLWKGKSVKVRVPSNWEAQGIGEPGVGTPHLCQDNAPKKLRHKFEGEGYYRRFFEVPADWAGRRVWLKAGGVKSQGWFFVNDRAVAWLDTAVGAWKWDVTDCIHPGPSNKIVVVADNVVAGRGGPSTSHNRWGGVWRDVELEAVPEVCIDDAWVRPRFDEAAAEARVVIDEGRRSRGDVPCRVRVTVDGRSVEKTAEAGENVLVVPMPGFREWTTEEPFLYWAKIELLENGTVVQTRHERFGMRKLEVRGKSFFFNNRPFFVRGAGDNAQYPVTGLTPPDRDFHRAHLAIAHRAGFNFLRLHTHAETPEYMEAADECGILVQPEIPYYLENQNDYFGYDPIRDADAMVAAFRRYPSFAVLSFGNEGLLGPAANRIVYERLKRTDPDRLVLAQDGGTYIRPDHAAGETDYISGPLDTWPRGTVNPAAFVCHEYLNLAAKFDWRDEEDFTGLWYPPMTVEDRRRPLAHSGLSDEWLGRLQDAAHALQKFWHRNGLEHARADPYCDGYLLWTICDSTPWNRKAESVVGQGVFDVFWKTKRHGTSPEELAVMNAPAVVLLDTETAPRDMTGRDDDIMLFCSTRGCVKEGTNRVYAVGETISAKFLFANFEKTPRRNAVLEWKLTADGRELRAGSVALGDLPLGNAREVASVPIVVPSVEKPVKAEIAAAIGPTRNSWPVWLFPAAKRLPEDGVVVAACGSPEADAARKAGKNLLVVANQTGPANVTMGWWNIGKQVGTAFLPHPVFGDFPYEPYLAPLHFRLFREGTALPVAGYSEKDYVVVGEGCRDAYLYLAAKVRPDGSREVFVSGLDVTSDRVESVTLRNNVIKWLRNGR